jgi:hypothetical protein
MTVFLGQGPFTVTPGKSLGSSACAACIANALAIKHNAAKKAAPIWALMRHMNIPLHDQQRAITCAGKKSTAMTFAITQSRAGIRTHMRPSLGHRLDSSMMYGSFGFTRNAISATHADNVSYLDVCSNIFARAPPLRGIGQTQLPTCLP